MSNTTAEQELEEMMDKVISGEVSQSDYDTFLEESLNPKVASGDTVDDTTGDSPDSEKEQETEVKHEEQPKADEVKADEVAEEDAVILTKDGKHTIPYSTLADAREEARINAEKIAELSSKLSENEGLIAQLQEAKEQDQEAGNTDATDELMADMAEDYPEAAKQIVDLKAQIQTLLEKDAAVEAVTAESKARTEFENSITALNKDYATVKNDDGFWKWFDEQPSYVKAAENSGDAQQIADVVKLYTDSIIKETPAPASDKAATDKKVEDAIKNAESRSSVNSLSDVPGATNSPEHDEANALVNMDAFDMAQKFMDMDPATIEAKLSKII